MMVRFLSVTVKRIGTSDSSGGWQRSSSFITACFVGGSTLRFTRQRIRVVINFAPALTALIKTQRKLWCRTIFRHGKTNVPPSALLHIT
jgi:hypothetical protein